MKPLAIVGALVAGIVGAIVWAVIAWQTNFEIGYLAWGIGALIGFIAVRLGARGMATAVACAAIALLSIFAGKMITVYLTFDQAVLDEVTSSALSKESYADDQALYSDARKVKTDDDLRRFMIKYELVESGGPGNISKETLTSFKENVIPAILKEGNKNESYEEWKARRESEIGLDAEKLRGMARENLTPAVAFEGVQSNLNLIDLIFAVLGISTAFGMVRSADEDKSTGAATLPSGQSTPPPVNEPSMSEPSPTGPVAEPPPPAVDIPAEEPVEPPTEEPPPR